MAVEGDELLPWEPSGYGPSEQKVLVIVRLRPLNEKEVLRNEISDWECIDDNTILYRNNLHEQSALPTAYKFDRVFRGDSSTKDVYERGVKDVAMSVVSGINSTVFAYGQTSSGKTYTMNGIADYTVTDIYDYIHKHEERNFVLKFSATEIYNEAVRDLLSSDNFVPLKLLDDPEKGTIIEKLTEVTLRDSTHLRRLLAMCDAQRRTGETPLNETSSRSHQILRLSIESSSREFLGKDKSTTLSASASFVDLAGSERASLAISSGTRLKEGCHINRSLLALGTVIRKLSKGKQGHVNYRDSKLTRILQPSLGGNARTAIICTLSPARSHVEQSKNTLSFASCAKEVSTKAQVNVVLSDKALVAYLQKELARLEGELRYTASSTSSCDYPELLREKNLQISKLEKEIRELTDQRRLAESRVQDLLQVIENIQASGQLDDDKWEDDDSMPKSSERYPDTEMPTEARTSIRNTRGHELLGNNIKKGDDNVKNFLYEDMKETRKDESNFSDTTDDEEDGDMSLPASRSEAIFDPEKKPAQDTGNGVKVSTQNVSVYGFSDVQPDKDEKITEPFVYHSPDDPFPEVSDPDMQSSITLELNRSPSFRDSISNTRSLPFILDEEEQSKGTTLRDVLMKDFDGRPTGIRPRLPSSSYDTNVASLSRNGSPSSVDANKINRRKTKTYDEENGIGTDALFSRLEGDQSRPELQLTENQVSPFGNGGSDKKVISVMINRKQGARAPEISSWPPEFETLQKSIFDLWERCHVSLVHRTHFFMLFQSDPGDIVYWDVEFKRLTFLNQSFEKNRTSKDSRALAQASRSVRHERESLSKSFKKKFSKDERNRLYLKWGIAKDSKCRKLQLMNQLWVDTTNINQMAESAAIVARLVRLSEQGEALRGMFQLSSKSSLPKHTLLTCNSLLGATMCDN